MDMERDFVVADTGFIVALLNEADEWHEEVKARPGLHKNPSTKLHSQSKHLCPINPSPRPRSQLQSWQVGKLPGK